MDVTTLITYVLSGLLAVFAVGVGYWWKKRNEPKHIFLARDLEVGSVMPKRIKNIFGPFKVKVNGKVIHFPVPSGFGQQRMDGKGLIFEGDINTGQLIRPDSTGHTYDFAHGIFLEKALADGRVQQIAASAKGPSGFKLEHVGMLVGVCIILLIVVVYMYSRSGGIA